MENVPPHSQFGLDFVVCFEDKFFVCFGEHMKLCSSLCYLSSLSPVGLLNLFLC